MKPAAPDCLFAYGTLEEPSVLKAVVGKEFGHKEAFLDGYACFRLKGAAFPGIIQASGESTEGTLYVAVDDRSLALVDCYEGDLYERREVVITTRDGKHRSAYAYVIADGRRRVLSEQPWIRLRR